MTRRRKLLVALGAGALTAPLASFAQQQGKVWRIGFLSSRARPEPMDADLFGGFPQGMSELGYIEGKNLVIEWRFADGRNDRLPELAGELVRLNVDVILAAGTPATSAAHKATATIPIVMGNTNDPVGGGFAKTLARPGGNVTGISNLLVDLGPKHLELLLSIMPKVPNVAVLRNPDNASTVRNLESIQAVAQKIGKGVLPVDARTAKEIESAFVTLSQQKVDAVIVLTDAFFIDQRRQITALATKHRLPSIAAFREYTEAGGLMSYGPNFRDSYRRAATYVDKILKGTKPGELPIEQPTKFELIINGRTAKALGLTVPQSILVRADRVIE